MIAYLFFLSFTVSAQTSFRPIIDKATLQSEAFSRTVFIRIFRNEDDEPERATGIILKDGYLVTNEHVLRPALKGERAIYHIYVNGKKSVHRFNDLTILGCDTENDLCLMKSSEKFDDAFWSLESPSFRSITKDKPIGLFEGEEINFTGFCDLFPSMKAVKYSKYSTSAYETKVRNLEHRRYDTAAISFTRTDGKVAVCGGDSGGPLFDQNLFLYGIVRDKVNNDGLQKSYAVPMNILRKFVEANKASKPILKVRTVDAISEMASALKALK